MRKFRHEDGQRSATPFSPMYLMNRLSLFEGGAAVVIPPDLDPKVQEHIGAQAVEKFKSTLPKAPEKYDVKLPEKATLTADVLEPVSTLARKMNLSNENAQELLAFSDGVAKSLRDKITSDYAPGGAEFQKMKSQWEAEALAHPDLGGGKPEVFTANLARINRLVDKVFPPETKKLLDDFGLGSNPHFLRGMAKIGQLMKEDDFIQGDSSKGTGKKSLAERIYPNQGATA